MICIEDIMLPENSAQDRLLGEFLHFPCCVIAENSLVALLEVHSEVVARYWNSLHRGRPSA